MDRTLVRVAIAPIGWTNDDVPELGGDIPFEQCVSEMSLAGYEGCEVGGKYPRDPEVLGRALSLRRLQICNAWFSMYLTTRPIADTVGPFREHCRFLASVGASVVGVSEQGGSVQGDLSAPIFDAKPVFDDTAWKRLTQGIRELARHASEFGIGIVYHHHMGTGVQTALEVDRLMNETRPEDLGLLFDTGHFAFSGDDYVAVLRKWIGRVGHVHLKDIRKEVLARVIPEKMSFLGAVREGVFTVPGDGQLDFAPVFRFLEAARYRGWMVVEAEQDPAKANPLAYAVKGREYIRRTAGI